MHVGAETLMLTTVSSYLPLTLTQLGWLGFTVLTYLGARWVYQRSGAQPILIPVLTAVIVIVAALLATDTSYHTYADATKILQFLIGPATVALAIPLYGQLHQLKRMWLPLTIALCVGSVTAIVSTVVIAWLLGGSMQTLLSLAPKSATIPIAVPASVAVGGIASLAAIAVAITGISGVIMARPLFRIIKADDPMVRGFAIGLTAHAIGTARALQVDQQAGASAALAMGLNGLLTAALIPFLPWFLTLFV